MTSDIRTEFRRDGFVVLRGVCAAALEAAQRDADVHLAGGASVRVDSSRKRLLKIAQLAPRSEAFRALARSPGIVDAVEAIVGPAALFRDVLLDKPAMDGAIVRDHQDIAYWDVSPADQVLSAWIALDDAPVESGCLEVSPGSQERLVRHRLVVGRWAIPNLVTRALRRASSLTGTGDNPRTESQRTFTRAKNFVLGALTHRFPGLGDLNDLHIDPERVSNRRAVPIRAGDAILFDSRLVHSSGPNTSPNRRRAYIASYMSTRCEVRGARPEQFLRVRPD